MENTESYDCTNEVLEHRRRVTYWLRYLSREVLEYRARVHDESKLHSPEKEIFDEFTPKLKNLKLGSDEYNAALEKMGEGLKHHYKKNPHHPEYYQRGIDGMAIWDLVEMLADWMAAASVKNQHMDLDYLQNRFDLSPQLRNIIANTLWAADMDTINFKIPEEFQQISNFVSEKSFEKPEPKHHVAHCPKCNLLFAFADEQGRLVGDQVNTGMVQALNLIYAERVRQNKKWGEQNHDDYRWLAILTEEVGELAQAILEGEFGGTHAGTAKAELVHVAAVAAQWLECMERRGEQSDEVVV